jgi:hypothetical protein
MHHRGIALIVVALGLVLTACGPVPSFQEANPNDSIADIYYGGGSLNAFLLNERKCPASHVDRTDPNDAVRCSAGNAIQGTGSVQDPDATTHGKDNWLVTDTTQRATSAVVTFAVPAGATYRAQVLACASSLCDRDSSYRQLYNQPLVSSTSWGIPFAGNDLRILRIVLVSQSRTTTSYTFTVEYLR